MTYNSRHTSLIMAALQNRAGQHFHPVVSSYGRPTEQGRPLYFRPVVSFFLLSFFLSFFFLSFFFIWPPYGNGVADADIIFLPCSLFWPPYLIGQAIIFLSCGLVSPSIVYLSFSSPNLTRHRCLPYFHTQSGLSANLECRSEMCFTRLAENTRRKMTQKFAI